MCDFGSVCEARVNFGKASEKSFNSQQQDLNETTTLSYCPPELLNLGGVLQEQPVDERSDIWVLLKSF